MSNEVMKKNISIKKDVAAALMHLACHLKHEDIDLNTIADCFEMTGDFRQPQQVSNDVAVIKSAISSSSSELSELQEIINVVNNVVTSTTNGTSSVQNLEDLKAFLNQAIPAWQNAMQNQTVFQQQFYRFPSHM